MASPRSSSPAQLDAQGLRSFLLSCTPDGSHDILPACRAVESFLHHQSPENAPHFYRLCFPILLQKVFGFQDCHSLPHSPSSAHSGGWLFLASSTSDGATGKALISLLSPTGPLFSSLLAVDRENAVRFVFPNERLPHWVRRLLDFEKGAFILCQVSDLFKNRIKNNANGATQLQLDVFEYYMFWFAYYAVCKDDSVVQGSSKNSRTRSGSRPSQIRSLGHWVSGLHHSFHHGASAFPHDLYLQLLHLYLLHFVQASCVRSKGCPTRPHIVQVLSSTDMSQGDFLLHTLVEFWLVDDDPSPLPVSVRQSLGLPSLGGVGLAYVPPGSEITGALRLLINYFNSLLKASLADQSSGYNSASTSESIATFRRRPVVRSDVGSPPFVSSLPSVTDSHLSPYPRLVQRPLYRFILRAFHFWPTGSPVSKASHLVDVWLDYLQPWNFHLEGKSGFMAEEKHWEDTTGPNSYSEKWQGYVTRNYFFYSSLVVHLLEFALKFVRMDPEAVLHMTSKVLSVLAGSKDLLDFLRRIDATYYNSISGRLEHSFSPIFDELFQEQIQDWEENITINDSRGGDLFHSPLLQSRTTQLRLFGTSENGGYQAFQMLILQAEGEIQAASGEMKSTIVRALEEIKDAGLKVFDSHPVCSSMGLHLETREITPQVVASKALRRHTCFDVKYRGDWMRRPIESTEVAWLARLLVKLSDSINRKLDLVLHENIQEEQQSKATCDGSPGMAEFPTEVTELDFAELFKASRNLFLNFCLTDFVKLLKSFLWRCWLILHREFHRRGWRVNLRFMAKKPIVFILMLLLFWMLKKILSHIPTYSVYSSWMGSAH